MAIIYTIIPFLVLGASVQLFRAYTERSDPYGTSYWKHIEDGVAHQPSGNYIPACSVWPDWRKSIAKSAPVDDHALPPSRIGIPEVMQGSSGLGCMPASVRLGPFGHSAGQGLHDTRPWSSVRWGKLQNDCVKGHFVDVRDTMPPRLSQPPVDVDVDLGNPWLDGKRTGRTAVVLRTSDAYHYSKNQLAWLRTITTELALDTGVQYQLFLIVDVKDQKLDSLDDNTHAEVIHRSVPIEFWDVALLFNERLLREWFPKVGQYGAQDQMYQAIQIFSYTYPEFDFVWQFEMEARVTGNLASMLSNAGLWAEKQPRRNLWERNGRWYIPGLWSNYSEFAAHVDEEFSNVEGIWGPHPRAGFYVEPQGPTPPKRSQTEWGVGEAAELITFAPLIDPTGTGWTHEYTVHGFHPASTLPRRMAITSMTRTSRGLLRLISAEQRASGSWVVSESTPGTWSLLHGLKAVYVPHLFAFNLNGDGLTPQQLHEMLHSGPAWSLAGGERTLFLQCGSAIGLPERRWLQASYFYWTGDASRNWWLYTNGTCTYPLLLHPIKHD